MLSGLKVSLDYHLSNHTIIGKIRQGANAFFSRMSSPNNLIIV